jgi:hypothetical protein
LQKVLWGLSAGVVSRKLVWIRSTNPQAFQDGFYIISVFRYIHIRKSIKVIRPKEPLHKSIADVVCHVDHGQWVIVAKKNQQLTMSFALVGVAKDGS